MKLKIIKGENGVGRELIEIESEESKIVCGFGEEEGTGDIPEKVSPMIDGLTNGSPSYDGIFILRNPENCNVVDYALRDIPIYLPKRLKSMYEVCMDFKGRTKKVNVKEMIDNSSTKIKDLEITPFIIDSSNFNTYFLKITDSKGKTVVVSGDFKNYEGNFGGDKLTSAISVIKRADVLVIEGKYLGKYGLENSSGKIVFEKLKNIMKFYKQVFVIQSETDMITAYNVYQAAMKSKKIFIESTLLSNLTTISNGSCPSPFSTKKVYSYNPLFLENEGFEFKKKYVAPFYISNALAKMKKEKYVMNITKDFFQDIQVFEKEGNFYDACIIFSEWKGFIEKDEELEEFINLLKNYDMDYYELYTHGAVNLKIIVDFICKLQPKYVIPLDFSNEKNIKEKIYNLKLMNDEEIIEI